MEHLQKTLSGIPANRIHLTQQIDGEDLAVKPSFYILDKSGLRCHSINSDQILFTFGKGEEADILIDDASISSIQMKAVMLMGQWYFMDCGIRDICSFNGMRARQCVAEIDSRCIIRIGQSWVIYCGFDESSSIETITSRIRRSLEHSPVPPPDHAQVIITTHAGFKHVSRAAPVLVGSHKICDLRDPRLAPFQFLIQWTREGVILDDLTNTAKLHVNGRKVFGSYPLMAEAHHINVENGLVCHLDISGVVDLQASELAKRYRKNPRLTLSSVTGLMSPIFFQLGMPRLTVGRSTDCHICIEHSTVSRLHCTITVRDKSLLIEDNNATNGTFINLKKISRAILTPGDVIEFGQSPFLLHYEI